MPTPTPSPTRIRQVAAKVRRGLAGFISSVGQDQWELFLTDMFGVHPSDAKAMIGKLTPRQREIAELLATSGLTNGGIAERLGISRKTLDIHRSKIYWKLDGKTNGVVARVWYSARFAE